MTKIVTNRSAQSATNTTSSEMQTMMAVSPQATSTASETLPMLPEINFLEQNLQSTQSKFRHLWQQPTFPNPEEADSPAPPTLLSDMIDLPAAFLSEIASNTTTSIPSGNTATQPFGGSEISFSRLQLQ